MNLTKKEEYLVFRVLLDHLKIGGADKLLAKLLSAHPEWQRFIDQKIESDKKVNEFRRRVLG